MFDISLPPPVPASAAGAAAAGPGGAAQWQQRPPQQQEEGQVERQHPLGITAEGEAGSERAPQRRVSFQNTLLPAVVPSQLQSPPASAPAGVGGAPSSSATATAAAAAAAAAEYYGGGAGNGEQEARPPSSALPLPAMPQRAAGSAAGAAPPAPALNRGPLLGMGIGFSTGGGRDTDWLFDISKRPPGE